jgi:tRNA(fMet)-specific endonuclease VapC
VRIFQHAPAIFLNSVVFGELLSGFAIGSRERANRDELNLFLRSARVSPVPLDYQTAERYANIYRALRNAGTPIPSNDIWIAASAKQHDLPLFSYDEHFQLVKGLRVGKSFAELMNL